MRHYHSQLKNGTDGAAIALAGGFVMVCLAGSPGKAAIYNKLGAAIANPMPLTNGSFDFNTLDSIAAVDLFIQSPTGHFIVKKAQKPSGNASININTALANTVMVIPFSYVDQTGNATETNTGFTVPNGSVLPQPAIDVVAIDAGITIAVGTLSTDSGVANGYMTAVSTAVAGFTKASLANGAVTVGADLKVQDSANAGDAIPEQNTNKKGKAITYTLSTGADTATGYIYLPVMLPVASL